MSPPELIHVDGPGTGLAHGAGGGVDALLRTGAVNTRKPARASADGTPFGIAQLGPCLPTHERAGVLNGDALLSPEISTTTGSTAPRAGGDAHAEPAPDNAAASTNKVTFELTRPPLSDRSLPPRFDQPLSRDPTTGGPDLTALESGKGVPDLRPNENEAVLDKLTLSAFAGTPLELALRGAGVGAIAIVGVATEIGIEPTTRHAGDLGFIPVVVTDARAAGNAVAGARALESLRFLGEALLTNVAAFRDALARGN
jgi:nicotinamidase-related amidase